MRAILGRSRPAAAYARFRGRARPGPGARRASFRPSPSILSRRPHVPNSTISRRLAKRRSPPATSPSRSSTRSPPKSPRPMWRRPATCTGGRPARTLSTARWCSSCAPRSTRSSRTSIVPSKASRRWPGAIAAPPQSRAPGCNMPFRCRSGSSLPAMRLRLRARASDWQGCAVRRLCCSSAARPARWRRSTNAGSRSRNGSLHSSICRFRKRPGIATGIGWRRLRRHWRSSPAPAARLPATCRS